MDAQQSINEIVIETKNNTNPVLGTLKTLFYLSPIGLILHTRISLLCWNLLLH